MKISLRTLLLLGLCFTQLLVASQEGRVLFLSHPKSGTRWATYSICTLMNRKLDFRLGDRPYDLQKGAFRNRTGGVVHAGHTPFSFRPFHDSSDKLILIVRNYRETYMSWHGNSRRVFGKIEREGQMMGLDEDREKSLNHRYFDYTNNLRVYEQWNPNTRFLIYYEDLVTKPEEVFPELVAFLEIDQPEEVLCDFLEKIDWHQSQCMQRAFRSDKDGTGKAKDLLKHSRGLGFKQCQEMDNKMKTLFPYYYETYLSRYELQAGQL